MPRATPGRALPRRPLPPEERTSEALQRLAGARALQTLVQGALPPSLLRRLLKDGMPRRVAQEMPEEAWSALAAGIAAEMPLFGMTVAQGLHDRLAWDREPSDPGEWDRLVAERPLEALWMAALSENKAVRRVFPRTAAECLRSYRASPACPPPSWDFVDGLLELQARGMRVLGNTEKQWEDAERRFETERQRADELREELKRLRRENSDLRAERSQAEKRAAAALQKAAPPPPADARRLEELDRRLRKAEKENEHLRREIARARPEPPPAAPDPEAPPPRPLPADPSESIAGDPNPRRRVLRQMLKRLIKKGKIGASHTHQDNVYRGVADHDKGIAKEGMDLLAREGFLMTKPTATDPHVSLNPDRVAEARAIVGGDISSPRIQRFVELGL